MSHFPCLEKDYIQAVLDPQESHLPDSWRSHLNSEILDKYLQIKRNQKQKIAEILPRYRIFPKNFNTYNIYTNQYDLDRLQRIKNASNAKYANDHKSKHQKSNSQQPSDMVFIKSASQVFGGNSNINRPGWDEQNRSALRFNESKSTKSLTQTQISPSKISKNFNQRNPSKQAIQSDSQLSGQRQQFFRQTRKQAENKSWTSNARSHKNAKRYNDDQKMFSNVESAITVVRKEKNGKINQQNQDYYYGPNRDFNGGTMRTVINEREVHRRKSSRSPKNLLYYHSNDEYEVGRDNKCRLQTPRRQNYNRQEGNEYSWQRQNQTHPEELIRKQTNRYEDGDQNQSNYFIESPFNPKYQQSQIQANRRVCQNRNQNNSGISESRKLNSLSQLKTTKSEITNNQPYQRPFNSKTNKQQAQSHHESSHTNTINMDQNQSDSPKISRLSQSKSNQQHNKYQERRFDPRNTFAKTPTIDNQTQITNIQDKLLEYYGEQFQRVKAERDYLRKNFIEHLEKHHTDKLPYKHLTQIKVDQTGKKLIITQKSVPFSRQEKNNQIYHAELVQYPQHKRRK